MTFAKTKLALLAAAALGLTACTTTQELSATPELASHYADDIVRLSLIEIDPGRIPEYKAFLKEEAETSVRIEPGVRVLYSAFEKELPHHLTILEIYDSPEAYRSHIASPHFVKYKEGTLNMVTKLDLVDCEPLSAQMPLKAPQDGSYANDMVRLSRIEIDPNRIDEYKAFLKEEAETSVRIEPGVRILYAAFEQKQPNRLTILEIYDNQEAYRSHIASPHFVKYKEGTLDMVTKLELIDCEPLSAQMPLKAPAAMQTN